MVQSRIGKAPQFHLSLGRSEEGQRCGLSLSSSLALSVWIVVVLMGEAAACMRRHRLFHLRVRLFSDMVDEVLTKAVAADCRRRNNC